MNRWQRRPGSKITKTRAWIYHWAKNQQNRQTIKPSPRKREFNFLSCIAWSLWIGFHVHANSQRNSLICAVSGVPFCIRYASWRRSKKMLKISTIKGTDSDSTNLFTMCYETNDWEVFSSALGRKGVQSTKTETKTSKAVLSWDSPLAIHLGCEMIACLLSNDNGFLDNSSCDTAQGFNGFGYFLFSWTLLIFSTQNFIVLLCPVLLRNIMTLRWRNSD